MVAVDDLRPMLGCYGDPRIKTPNIDRLAGRGMLFERAYCNYAKCGPSRLSLMTGLRPDTIGVFSHRDSDMKAFRERRPDAVSFARWFRDHGYEARSFGKIDHDGWANPEDWSAPPFAGRESEMLEMADPVNPSAPTFIAERAACPVLQSPDVGDDHLFAGRMTREVLRLLKERKAERPFFFAVGYRRPHLPFIAPKRYFDLYRPDPDWLAPNRQPPAGVPFFAWFNSDGYAGLAKRLGEPMPGKITRADAIAFNGFEMRSYLGVPLRGELPEDLQLKLIHAYAACVSYVDAQIGRLLDEIGKAGSGRDTILLLWSDHGWHLGESSVWGKMTNYEVGTRVPLIIAAPGFSPGRTRSLAELVDLYPTLCELAGIPAPGHLQGKSLAPVLKDPGAVVNDAVRHEYVRFNGKYTGLAIRTDRHRYVRWRDGQGKTVAEELYDLEADPLETENLASRRPELVTEMRRFFRSEE